VVLRLLGVAYAVLATLLVFVRPNALPEGVGLDPSWTIGIARAAGAHLVFGRDIVFSYGPLGYLIDPIADVGTTAAIVALRLAIAALVFAAVVECVYAAGSPYRKAVLAVSAPIVLSTAPSDIWPTFFILLVFVLRTVPRRDDSLAFFGTGLFGGIFILTKFTLAIDIGSIAFAFFTVRTWAARRDRTAAIASAADALVFSAGAIAASAFKFVSIDAGVPLAIGIEVAGLAGMVGTELWQRASDGAATAVRRIAIGGFTASLFLVVAGAASPAYRRYIVTSVTLAGGYSAAHSVEGPAWQLEGAVLWLAAFALVAWSMRRQETAPAAIALVVYDWAIFKLGFVRQDLHVVYFYGGSIFAALLLLISTRTRRTLVSASIVFLGMSVMLNQSRMESYHRDLLTLLTIPALTRNLATIVHLQRFSDHIDAFDEQRIKADTLPASIRRAVGNRPIDAAPTETAFVFANNFNWDPEPVFQTIMAYTPALDAIDMRSLENRRDDAILYSFGSIDQRFPNGDEPFAFRYMLCHYAPFTAPDAAGSPLLLLRSNRRRCSQASSGAASTAPWEQPIAIPHVPGRLTFARLWIRPNLAGRALTFAFRAPPVTVTVSYADGTSLRYRVVTANGPDGLLVDPLPRDAAELAMLFTGDLEAKATALSFQADSRWYHTPEIAFDSFAYEPKR
jgi:hypothetical protein